MDRKGKCSAGATEVQPLVDNASIVSLPTGREDGGEGGSRHASGGRVEVELVALIFDLSDEADKVFMHATKRINNEGNEAGVEAGSVVAVLVAFVMGTLVHGGTWKGMAGEVGGGQGPDSGEVSEDWPCREDQLCVRDEGTVVLGLQTSSDGV